MTTLRCPCGCGIRVPLFNRNAARTYARLVLDYGEARALAREYQAAPGAEELLDGIVDAALPLTVGALAMVHKKGIEVEAWEWEQIADLRDWYQVWHRVQRAIGQHSDLDEAARIRWIGAEAKRQGLVELTQAAPRVMTHSEQADALIAIATMLGAGQVFGPDEPFLSLIFASGGCCFLFSKYSGYYSGQFQGPDGEVIDTFEHLGLNEAIEALRAVMPKLGDVGPREPPPDTTDLVWWPAGK